ncbi:MAG: sialate O-acetylesterase [Bacteroidales bacterium]|nr:sialate O-acetylesterase [Bacteroidales bacterium]
MKKFLAHIATLAAGIVATTSTNAELKLPHIIGSNMVIQQQTGVRLWGEGKGEVTIKTSWQTNLTNVKVDNNGSWEAVINTPAASFDPQTIEITDADNKTVRLDNILIGEVWLASGQSNMEMPLKGFPGCFVEGGAEEIMNSSTEKGVRFFTVPLKHSYTEESDTDAEWTIPSASTSPQYSAVAWHYAKFISHALNVPVGIVSCAYGGTKVESWMSKSLLESYGLSTRKEDIENTSEVYLRRLLPYNAMFMPVHRFTYKGIIFYQGESNVGEQYVYASRLADMVKLWRKQIGCGDIPFYYVEIAPYCYDDPIQTGKAAYFREAQYRAIDMIPNSGMVSTCDLVLPEEYHNIHPRKKKEVGLRLASLSLNKTYGMKQFITGGPIFNKDFKVEGREAFVGFDNLPMGICSNYMIEGFEVAGSDKVFYPADKVWLRWQTNHVVVSSSKVSKPVAVRYCFKDFSRGTLYGGFMTPAYPFRTDNW